MSNLFACRQDFIQNLKRKLAGSYFFGRCFDGKPANHSLANTKRTQEDFRPLHHLLNGQKAEAANLPGGRMYLNLLEKVEPSKSMFMSK